MSNNPVVPIQRRSSNPEYDAYLQSDRWRKLRLAVKLRAKGRCEICQRAEGRECAHLTYERVFNEPMCDLVWLCRPCHRELDKTYRGEQSA